MRWRDRVPHLLLAATVATFGIAAVRVASDRLHDDAFISMRYARNLARGDGLVFNRGEHVEGFTNFLWTVGLAIPYRLGLNGVAWTGAASMFAGLWLVVAVFTLARHEAGSAGARVAVAAAALAAAHPLLVAESVGGLETTLFVLLVVLALEREAAERAGRARPGGWAAASALATLVRPEGALAFACVAFLRCRDPDTRVQWRRDLGIYLVLVLPLVAFRFVYYGDWVPNTYHAKVAFGTAQIARGLRYAWEYGGRALLLAMPWVVLAAVTSRGWPRRAALVAVAHTIWVVAVGGDFAPTGRFLLLPIVLASALAARGLGQWLQASGGSRGRTAFAALALGVAMAWAIRDEASVLGARRWADGYRRDLQARRFVGTWLAKTQSPDTRIAVGSIGAIGYYSDRRLIDAFGLTDAEIGRISVEWMGQASAGHEKGDAESVLRRAPDIILFDRAFLAPRELGLDEFLAMARSPTEHLLLEDPRFYERYGLQTVATTAGIVHYLKRIP